MRHGSLFSGIGGFDLAAEWMGWENVFHCEWNEFGQKVLKHYWPKAISYNDITTTDFTIHRGNIDILTGGFPCQPYSQAGKRLGKADERHLWPHMLRSIREIQPTYVVAENVRGLVNWNGGMVFNEVQADLEAAGYEVTPFLLPACGVNAPHRRDRVWFVAKNTKGNGWASNIREEESGVRGFGNVSTGDNERICPDNGETFIHPPRNGRNGGKGEHEINASEGGEYALNDVEQVISYPEQQGLEGRIRTQGAEGLESGCEGASTNPNGERSKERNVPGKSIKQKFINSRNNEYGNDWQNFPTQPPICGGDDGLPRQLDGITFPKWRNETIKAYGNAIVPQVALQIFKAIQKTHERL